MDKQTREARDMAKNLPFGEKIQHFWEYYKWRVVVVLFIAFLVISTIHQVITRVDYDLQVAYYGSVDFTEEQAAKLTEYLSGVIEDIDGNGEKNVNVVIMGSAFATENMQMKMALEQAFASEIAAGIYGAYILDEQYCEAYGPTSDAGVIETAFDMTQNSDISKPLGLGEEPLYWCTRRYYKNEQEDEEKQLIRHNALLAEALIKGE